MQPYYEDEWVTIYHGDCREILPALQYDSLFADPPYGIGKDYKNGVTDNMERFIETVTWLSTLEKPLAVTMPVLHLWSIPKPQWVAVWEKPLSLGYWAVPLRPHWEPICLWNVPKHPTCRDIFISNPDYGQGHPTQKPLCLLSQILEILPGTVCDPFMGSGTTLRAAKDKQRKAIGIDIHEPFCEFAATRMAQEPLSLGV